MAVAVPGNGLIVPVVKNADALSLRGLCRAVNDLAIRAREKKLTMDDLTGGTFTFSNVGSFGTLMALQSFFNLRLEFTPLARLQNVSLYYLEMLWQLEA